MQASTDAAMHAAVLCKPLARNCSRPHSTLLHLCASSLLSFSLLMTTASRLLFVAVSALFVCSALGMLVSDFEINGMGGE